MNQRTFLGLTHNPFSPPREGFFNGADRKTHLDHLRHLSQWSRRILVVTGPFGIGKSTLFKELSASLEANAKGARLSGSVVTTEREVLMGLLQGFGVGGEMDGHADDLGALIAAHADEQERHERVCMVMVDDAHLLEVSALQRLVSLVADSALRLVMFGEESVVSNLNRAAKKFELEWFEIRLTGFPKSDVRDYLEWRFRQAQYRGLLPFTDEQLDKIVSRSGGNPGVIDSMANRLLADMESGEIRKQGISFPLRHAVLAGVLLLMVSLIYLYVQTEPAPADEMAALTDTHDTTADADPAAPVPATDIDDTDAADTPRTSFEIDTDESGPVDEPDPAVQAAPDEAQTVRQAEMPAMASVDDPVVPAATEPSAASADEDPMEPEPAGESAPTERETDPAPALVEVVESSPEPGLPEPSQPAPAVERVAGSTANAAFHDAAWLLAQEPGRYTMQLLSLSSQERAVAFIERQDDPGEFALYRMQRDGRTLYVVTYGLFSTRDAAAAAAANLRGELASIQPWIRPLRLVQDTVRTNSQG